MDVSAPLEVNLANASLCFPCHKGFCQDNMGCQEYNNDGTPKCRCKFEYIKVNNACRLRFKPRGSNIYDTAIFCLRALTLLNSR
ncbi:unnamed protein product [Didymodactylos carnosus]|uniref:Uncharacterized protein n=1 Tax=Didymodactylos carnosus TaxID=1234261 RepID=A0A8S2GD91_9BILA|nr:unnamed protein product [Didymodactylos carnosus]CAF4512772.1 unnamed protein product [Didymodactylos carnosus]